MKIVGGKKVVYTTILTEIGQIVVWTTFCTTTFSPSIKCTILQFALIFVKILWLQYEFASVRALLPKVFR